MLRWLVLVGLVVCLVLLQRATWLTASSLPKGWHLQEKVTVQKKDNAHLQASNKQLWAEVKSLQNGLGAIQEHARMDLGFVKRGETFYQIVKPPRTGSVSRAEAAESAPASETVEGAPGGI